MTPSSPAASRQPAWTGAPGRPPEPDPEAAASEVERVTRGGAGLARCRRPEQYAEHLVLVRPAMVGGIPAEQAAITVLDRAHGSPLGEGRGCSAVAMSAAGP